MDAARKPPPFNLLLDKLARDSADIVRSLRDRLNAQWKAAQVAPFSGQPARPLPAGPQLDSVEWRRAGRRARFRRPAQFDSMGRSGSGFRPEPFRWRTARCPLAAFGRFFGSNGLMDRFFKQYLQPHIDTSQGSWRWRGPTGPEQSIARKRCKPSSAPPPCAPLCSAMARIPRSAFR